MPFDVRECVYSSLTMLAVRANEKGLELLCDVDPQIPSLMTGRPHPFAPGHSEPGWQCHQVHSQGRGRARRPNRAAARSGLAAELYRLRHWYRHTREPTGAHLRTLLSSRLIDHQEIWRYGPGAYHLHPPGSGNGRNNQCGQRARSGKQIFVYCVSGRCGRHRAPGGRTPSLCKPWSIREC